MEVFKTLFCCSKYPRARERISSKCIDNLGTLPQEGSPALPCSEGTGGSFPGVEWREGCLPLGCVCCQGCDWMTLYLCFPFLSSGCGRERLYLVSRSRYVTSIDTEAVAGTDMWKAVGRNANKLKKDKEPPGSILTEALSITSRWRNLDSELEGRKRSMFLAWIGVSESVRDKPT